jgi:hypothetical protein
MMRYNYSCVAVSEAGRIHIITVGQKVYISSQSELPTIFQKISADLHFSLALSHPHHLRYL